MKPREFSDLSDTDPNWGKFQDPEPNTIPTSAVSAVDPNINR